MKWAWDAEKEISKIPFFVRKTVRRRIEKEALEQGRAMVSLDDVHNTRKRFLSNMESDIKGYQIEACFSQGGCPNSCVEKDTLTARLEALLVRDDILGFLGKSVPGKLRFHHEFRISVSHCPNAPMPVPSHRSRILVSLPPCTPGRKTPYAADACPVLISARKRPLPCQIFPFPLLMIPGPALAAEPAFAPAPQVASCPERGDTVFCWAAG